MMACNCPGGMLPGPELEDGTTICLVCGVGEKVEKRVEKKPQIKPAGSWCGVPGCGLPQFIVVGHGVTCDNGHGGAPSLVKGPETRPEQVQSDCKQCAARNRLIQKLEHENEWLAERVQLLELEIDSLREKVDEKPTRSTYPPDDDEEEDEQNDDEIWEME